jgi:hypothetical protein
VRLQHHQREVSTCHRRRQAAHYQLRHRYPRFRGAGRRDHCRLRSAGNRACFRVADQRFLNGYYIEARQLEHKTAIFRQINREQAHMHHDAVEFPDGQLVLLTHLKDGQDATVLQLPATPKTEVEAREQGRVAYAG